jgi:hypothetical protein
MRAILLAIALTAAGAGGRWIRTISTREQRMSMTMASRETSYEWLPRWQPRRPRALQKCGRNARRMPARSDPCSRCRQVLAPHRSRRGGGSQPAERRRNLRMGWEVPQQ